MAGVLTRPGRAYRFNDVSSAQNDFLVEWVAANVSEGVDGLNRKVPVCNWYPPAVQEAPVARPVVPGPVSVQQVQPQPQFQQQGRPQFQQPVADVVVPADIADYGDVQYGADYGQPDDLPAPF